MSQVAVTTVARCPQREHDSYDARPPTLDGLVAALGQPRLGIVQIDRGTVGVVPYAAMGSGRPVVVLAGLSPRVGVAGDGFVRGVLAPVRGLVERRRLIVFNRRPGLAAGLSMGELAAEYAEAIVRLGAPVDVVGVSTGGSIAQQLAADHGAVVGRLVLLSTACRLGGVGRRVQSTVAAELRAGRTRRAVSVAAGGIAPKSLRPVARGVGWLAAPRVVTSQSAAADLAVTLEAEDGFDLAKCEGRVQAPTLIIAGGRDRFYSPALFRETAALIPGSALRLLPSRGHLTVMRDRRALAMLAGFLSWPDQV